VRFARCAIARRQTIEISDTDPRYSRRTSGRSREGTEGGRAGGNDLQATRERRARGHAAGSSGLQLTQSRLHRSYVCIHPDGRWPISLSLSDERITPAIIIIKPHTRELASRGNLIPASGVSLPPREEKKSRAIDLRNVSSSFCQRALLEGEANGAPGL